MKSKKELKEDLSKALIDTGLWLMDFDSSNFELDYETGIQYIRNTNNSLEKRFGKYRSVRIQHDVYDNYLQKIIVSICGPSEFTITISKDCMVKDADDLKEWLEYKY